MIRPSFFCLFVFVGISFAFDKEAFLSKCTSGHDLDSEDFENCLQCVDIELSDKDLEEFKSQSLNISNEECIVFDDGDLNIVSGDFLKQFPGAKIIVFQGGRFKLSTSTENDGNESLQNIRIEHSQILGSEVVGAFDDLSNLTTLTLEKVRFESVNMKDGLKIILENLTSLKAVTICGPLEEFPLGIPSTIEEITICDYQFDRVTRDNLDKFKDLKVLSIYTGNLKTLDENAFDDLEKLEELDLEYNLLEKFQVRHLLNNKNIKRVALDPVEHADLTEIGLWETSRTGYFVKEEEVEDYNDSY
ncbi:hypothetical protein ACFFRR_003927 [Megaselia abdita]